MKDYPYGIPYLYFEDAYLSKFDKCLPMVELKCSCVDDIVKIFRDVLACYFDYKESAFLSFWHIKVNSCVLMAHIEQEMKLRKEFFKNRQDSPYCNLSTPPNLKHPYFQLS